MSKTHLNVTQKNKVRELINCYLKLHQTQIGRAQEINAFEVSLEVFQETNARKEELEKQLGFKIDEHNRS